jgi:hypothetical protein
VRVTVAAAAATVLMGGWLNSSRRRGDYGSYAELKTNYGHWLLKSSRLLPSLKG